MMEWFYILLTVFTGSAGDILCAKGMSESDSLENIGVSGVGRAVREIVTQRLVIVGWICYAVSFFALMGLLSVAQLTVAIPATALSFVVDTLGACFILREHIPWKRWLGVVCVTAGVILAMKPVPSAVPHAPALAWSSGANGGAMQTCHDQAGDNQSGAQQLDEQRARCEVLAKP